MGLDMYLDKAKRVKGVTAKDLIALEHYFSYVTRSEEYRNSTIDEYSGSNMKDVKFDLTKHYIEEYKHKYAEWDTEKKYGYKTIFTKVGYWRKANHIHNWFVQNIQDGKDDCGLYEVSKEKLKELLELCLVVLRESRLVDGKVFAGRQIKNGDMVDIYEEGKCIEDPSLAKELLPTASGFFFGGTAYDEWYYKDLENTVEILMKVLNETNFENEMIVYQSSW